MKIHRFHCWKLSSPQCCCSCWAWWWRTEFLLQTKAQGLYVSLTRQRRFRWINSSPLMSEHQFPPSSLAAPTLSLWVSVNKHHRGGNELQFQQLHSVARVRWSRYPGEIPIDFHVLPKYMTTSSLPPLKFKSKILAHHFHLLEYLSIFSFHSLTNKVDKVDSH